MNHFLAPFCTILLLLYMFSFICQFVSPRNHLFKLILGRILIHFFMSLQKCILLVQRQVYSSGIIIIIIIIIIILVIIEWSHVNFYQRICFNFEGWCQQGTSQVKNFSENSVFMSQDSLHESIQVPLSTLKRFGIDLLLNFTMVVT